jgi:zinc transporter ZupT
MELFPPFFILRGMSTIGFKVGSAFAVLGVTAIGAVIPFWMRKQEQHGGGEAEHQSTSIVSQQFLMSISGQLTSGVFIGAALIHLLPDSIRLAGSVSLPVVLAGCGLLFADLCQSITSSSAHGNKNLVLAAAALASNPDDHHDHHHHHNGTICLVHGECVTGHSESGNPLHILINPLREQQKRRNSMEQRFLLSGEEEEPSTVLIEENEDQMRQCPNSPCPASRFRGDEKDLNASGCLIPTSVVLQHSHVAVPGNGGLPYVVAVLLGFHSFIAGIALGATTTLSDGIALLTAVVAHKWAESFALSLTLVKQFIPMKQSLGIVCLYSAMCPLGIVVSTILSEYLEHDEMHWLQVVFSSFASGSFLYVAAIHMLEKDYQPKCAWLFRLVAQSFGFMLMWLISLWI